MYPTVGKIVRYILTAVDEIEINRRRLDAERSRAATSIEPGTFGRSGVQAHVGNPVHEGDEVAMLVTAVWPGEYGPGTFGVNGQVILDGSDSLWVTSAKQGTNPGEWCWPPVMSDAEPAEAEPAQPDQPEAAPAASEEAEKAVEPVKQDSPATAPEVEQGQETPEV